mmetsp:Transcript_7286/g.18517  ORF Transcript_7286/g.18517 Transcript_7286/m.18517 type:complete len:217 (-) Transcript_7286:1426-2076(-)
MSEGATRNRVPGEVEPGLGVPEMENSTPPTLMRLPYWSVENTVKVDCTPALMGVLPTPPPAAYVRVTSITPGAMVVCEYPAMRTVTAATPVLGDTCTFASKLPAVVVVYVVAKAARVRSQTSATATPFTGKVMVGDTVLTNSSVTVAVPGVSTAFPYLSLRLTMTCAAVPTSASLMPSPDTAVLAGSTSPGITERVSGGSTRVKVPSAAMRRTAPL